MTAPDTVKLPPTALEPMINVPAVIADKSEAPTVKVPVPPATMMDLLPLGMRDTVPEPALTEPEKATSSTVIVIAELVEEIDRDEGIERKPVPSVVIVTPLVPVALAAGTMLPLDPEDVCNTNELPESTWLFTMSPLAVRVSVPLVDVTAPKVPMFADAPVVVMEKLPPTVDVPILTAPLLVNDAVPGEPVLAVSVEVAV